MLCNSCGKVLEGKATLCTECEAKGGEWTKTYSGVVHKPDDSEQLEAASKFGVDEEDKKPQEPVADSPPAPAPKKMSRVALIALSLFTVVLVLIFYQFGQMGASSEARSERALAHSAPLAPAPSVGIPSADLPKQNTSDELTSGNPLLHIDSTSADTVGINESATAPDANGSAKSSAKNSKENSKENSEENSESLALNQAYTFASSSAVTTQFSSLPNDSGSSPVETPAAPLVVTTVDELSTVSPSLESLSSGSIAEPTPIATAASELFENLVRFGAVKLYFPASVAFFNRTRTQLRIYLSQNELDAEKISALSAHDIDSQAIPLGSDVAFVIDYPTKIDADCSFSRAKQVSAIMYRTGITGFPLPGRGNRILLTPSAESLQNTTLKCSIGNDSKTDVSGILDGSGDYTQGQALYTLNWKVKLGS